MTIFYRLFYWIVGKLGDLFAKKPPPVVHILDREPWQPGEFARIFIEDVDVSGPIYTARLAIRLRTSEGKVLNLEKEFGQINVGVGTDTLSIRNDKVAAHV